GKSQVRIGEVVDTREQRRAVLTQLGSKPVARLLVVCDARVSPDRGSLSWLVELSALVGEIAVWLVGSAAGSASREQVWRDSLTSIGLAQSHILTAPAAARDWLHHG